MNIKINNSMVQNVKVCQKCQKRPLLNEHVQISQTQENRENLDFKVIWRRLAVPSLSPP